MGKTTFLAAGDAFISRHLPKGGYDGFQAIKDCICKHDVKFLNLEMTFHDHKGYPAAASGGTWAMADPKMLDDLQSYGFNLYNTANNHSCDYSDGGVLETIKNLKERDMIFAGTGDNLANASQACYLELPGVRVAMIGVTASFNDASRAGGQSGQMQGRPGLNYLRTDTTYHVTQAYYDTVVAMAEELKVNVRAERSIRNGYRNPFPEGTVGFDKMKFKLDDSTWVERKVVEADMVRIEAEVREAKRQADVVLVSIHSHETDYGENDQAPPFMEVFSRRCIDAGADAILGHGPHEVHGIEIYKNKPIFYSIGNFLFETETVSVQPYDAYVNKKMSPETKVGEFMSARSKNGTTGYGVLPEIWSSVLIGWTMEEEDVTEIQLYPIDLGMKKKRSQKGIPTLTDDISILEHLQKLSEPYNTKIDIRDGVGYISIKK